MPGPRSMLAVSAHAADFVWRAAGAVALHTAAGGEAAVVSLSYGERGESGSLWRQPGQTVEAVRRIRREEAAAAASVLGARFVALDLGDFPLAVDEAALERLVGLFIETAPDVVLVHAPEDPFNPDHPTASEAARRARLLVSGAGGAPAAFPTIPPPMMYAFEPHQPDLCNFKPDVFLDITPVWGAKRKAMQAMGAQAFLHDHYEERARQRAFQSRYAGAGPEVEYAEAFQRLTPELRSSL